MCNNHLKNVIAVEVVFNKGQSSTYGLTRYTYLADKYAVKVGDKVVVKMYGTEYHVATVMYTYEPYAVSESTKWIVSRVPADSELRKC